jgi:cysteine desulfurase
MRRKPKIVSVMLANNETGVLQAIEPLAALSRSAGAWFHTDAVQALGKIEVDFRRLNAAGVNA